MGDPRHTRPPSATPNGEDDCSLEVNFEMEESGERPRSCDAIASVLTGGGLPPCSFEPRRGHMPPSAQQELRRALAALLLPTLAVGSRCSMRRTQTISIEAPQFAEITWRAHKSTNKFKLAKLAKSHNKYYYRILYPLSTCYAHAPNPPTQSYVWSSLTSHHATPSREIRVS